LYKIQLEKAQQEIFRAQDVLSVIDRRRYEAEKESAEYRGTIRKLKEAHMIEQAREEGRRKG
jgi:multidrug resistance efflux pump